MIEAIVAALAAGATEVLKPAVAEAIKDGYTALKTAIAKKFGAAAPAIEVLEKNPDKPAYREVAQAELADAEVDKDAEVQQLTQTLLAALKASGTTPTTQNLIKDNAGIALIGGTVHGNVVQGNYVQGNQIRRQINQGERSTYVEGNQYVKHQAEPPEQVSANPVQLGKALHQALSTYFNEEELEALCYDLGIDWEDLKGETKIAKARAIVGHCERREILEALRTKIVQARPTLKGRLLSGTADA